jgi:WD40 repeat protein
MRHILPWPTAVLIGVLLPVLACGGADVVDPGPSRGSITVVTSTGGSDPDPDGYGVAVDGKSAPAIGVNASLTVDDLSSGTHLIALSGIAQNCTLSGGNPRAVEVRPGEATRVTFELDCPGPSLEIVVRTHTTGFGTDSDGYLVSLDQGEPRAVGTEDSLTFGDVAAGSHSIELTGMVPGCTVAEPNPVSVTIGGVGPQLVDFSVTCTVDLQADLLFTGDTGGESHVFHRSPDGSITDLTPDADAAEGRWSPDGTRIVFSSVRSGTLGIWIMDAEGKNPVQLTNNGERAADWSPDGTRIVFGGNATPGFDATSVMNSDGSGVQVVGRGSQPVWSPDGTRIAVTRAELTDCIFDICPLNIYTMNTDGTDAHRLTANSQPFSGAVSPAWSPDGRQIAFIAGDLGRPPALKIMSATGGGVRTLLSESNLSGSPPVWSPSGNAIALAENGVGQAMRIRIIPLTGGLGMVLLERQGTVVPTSWK